jgi:hypothetical protein
LVYREESLDIEVPDEGAVLREDGHHAGRALPVGLVAWGEDDGPGDRGAGPERWA